MPKASARANARKSAIRARVEHVFAHQKNRFGLFIRTLKRAEAKLTLANLAYNMDRLIFHERRATAVRPECGFRRKKCPATAICGEKNAVSKNHNWPQQGINPELIRVSNSIVSVIRYPYNSETKCFQYYYNSEITCLQHDSNFI